jgi:hypothetical protein
VSLIGIDSAQCPRHIREELWQRLAGEWKPSHLAETVNECTLGGLEEKIQGILKGQIRGRVVVDLLES